MAIRKTVSVSIIPALFVFAEQMPENGRYGNIGEVVRAALRLMEERELNFQRYRATHEARSLKPMRKDRPAHA